MHATAKIENGISLQLKSKMNHGILIMQGIHQFFTFKCAYLSGNNNSFFRLYTRAGRYTNLIKISQNNWYLVNTVNTNEPSR